MSNCLELKQSHGRALLPDLQTVYGGQDVSAAFEASLGLVCKLD